MIRFAAAAALPLTMGSASGAAPELPQGTKFHCGKDFVTVVAKVLNVQDKPWALWTIRKADVMQVWRHPGRNTVISIEPVALEVPASDHHSLIACLD